MVMKSVTLEDGKTPWVVVGCEDGTVAVLDGQSDLIHLDSLAGQPTCIEAFSTPAGPVVLLATDQGEVKGLRM